MLLTAPCQPTTADNQVKMAKEGGLEMLITLLKSSSDLVQRQAAKALANLGVNSAFAVHAIVCVRVRVSSQLCE